MSASASSREQRLAQLLDTIRTHPGTRWTVGSVKELRRLTGSAPQRNTARHDLRELYRRGHLNMHGPDNDRSYSLRLRRDGS